MGIQNIYEVGDVVEHEPYNWRGVSVYYSIVIGTVNDPDQLREAVYRQYFVIPAVQIYYKQYVDWYNQPIVSSTLGKIIVASGIRCKISSYQGLAYEEIYQHNYNSIVELIKNPIFNMYNRDDWEIGSVVQHIGNEYNVGFTEVNTSIIVGLAYVSRGITYYHVIPDISSYRDMYILVLNENPNRLQDFVDSTECFLLPSIAITGDSMAFVDIDNLLPTVKSPTAFISYLYDLLIIPKLKKDMGEKDSKDPMGYTEYKPKPKINKLQVQDSCNAGVITMARDKKSGVRYYFHCVNYDTNNIHHLQEIYATLAQGLTDIADRIFKLQNKSVNECEANNDD